MTSPVVAEELRVRGLSDALQHSVRRFFTLYFVLFSLPFPLNFLPPQVTRAFTACKEVVSLWIGRHWFSIEGEIMVASSQGTSTDRVLDYLWLVALLVLALVGTLFWSSYAPRVRAERPLMGAARIYLRYMLGVELIGYGLFKVLPIQFGTLTPSVLTLPVGELVPMRLLWAFMAASTPYTIFAGAAEVVGACLLFFRRTTLLGALILIGVMTNVVLLNFCYDVPIKVKSSHLLGVALYLAAPDARRLWAAVVAARPDASFLPRSRPARLILLLAKLGFLGLAVAVLGLLAWRAYTSERLEPRHPLYGVWEVETLQRNGSSQASLPDASRWHRVAIHADAFNIVAANAQRRHLEFEHDAKSETVQLTDPVAKTPLGTLRLARTRDSAHGVERMRLEGPFEGEPLSVQLRRKDDFTLATHGFHWVNDRSPPRAQ